MTTLNTAKTLNALVRRERTSSENWNARSADTRKTFKAERHRFTGIKKTYMPFEDDEDSKKVQVPEERKVVGTTTLEEIQFLGEFFVTAMNEAVQKERSNASAKANLEVFGLTFQNLPATALLNMEHKLSALKQAIKQIPTLDDSKDWEVANNPRGIFKQRSDAVSFKTEKRPFNHVKAAATDKHPAQVEVVHKDVQVGQYTTRFFSGEIPISAKTRLFERIDEALKAVVDARETANLAETVGPEDFSALFVEIVRPIHELFEGSAG